MTFRPRIVQLLALLHRDEEAQGLAEYALILALIAMVAVLAVVFLGSQLSGELSAIGHSIASVAP